MLLSDLYKWADLRYRKKEGDIGGFDTNIPLIPTAQYGSQSGSGHRREEPVQMSQAFVASPS
jgi:hypothetical protein